MIDFFVCLGTYLIGGAINYVYVICLAAQDADFDSEDHHLVTSARAAYWLILCWPVFLFVYIFAAIRNLK